MPMHRVYVSGKVQKIGFRDWVVRRAQAIGVTGWVRNLKDGRVELLVDGDDDRTSALIDELREGPPQARIDHVETIAAQERTPKGFTKRFTV